MPRFGFGFVETGTVTPKKQEGNDKPRLFRLDEDRAVINRMGFNSRGHRALGRRLKRRDPEDGVVGVNLGANRDSEDPIADYVLGVARFAPLADYLVLNVSSPNTKGLRGLQDAGALDALLGAAMAEAGKTPVFLKLAPELDRRAADRIAKAAIAHGIGALILTNTTTTRPLLRSEHKDEEGGLSGAPLKGLALTRLRDFRAASGGALPLIAVGGIENGADAWARIRAGASLVQIYTAMVFEGPGVAARITNELLLIMRRRGVTTLAEVVGSE